MEVLIKEKFDIESLNYEELCELEDRIVKRKKDFVLLRDLFIYDDPVDLPHLCYCSRYGYGTNPFYAGYYPKFSDVFDGGYVCEGFGRDEETLLYYLKRNHIAFEDRHYSKKELAMMWKPIEKSLLTVKLDKQQESLNEKRKRLGLDRK